MKPIKKLQMLMLATILAMTNQKLSAGSTAAQQSAAKASSQKNFLLKNRHPKN